VVRAIRLIKLQRAIPGQTLGHIAPPVRAPAAPHGAECAWPVLLLFWLIPVLMQLRHSQPVQMHYLLPTYPAPFIIMAWVIDAALRRARRRAVQWVGAVMLAGVLSWQSFTYQALLAFVAAHDTAPGGYGLPARNGLLLAAEARQRAAEVIVVTPGSDPNVDEQAAIWDVLLAGAPHRFADSEAGLILRPDGAQYLFTPSSRQAYERLRELLPADIAAAAVFTQPVRVGSQATYILLHMKSVDLLGRGVISASNRLPKWEHGVSLLGQRIEMTPARSHLRIDLFLGVESPASAGTDYHWFNHVLVDGDKLAQVDGGGIHPANWRVGDVLWHWFDLPVPPGGAARPAGNRLGSYRYPQIENLMLTRPDGSVGDGVEIPIALHTLQR
ncbi:MAG: hypothetical protein RMN25_14555, partial [Anaerolineae bacterium]|nr:hypothetical protein [Thermoflexales bacterium]MDW8408992.1 hypothetical protein [Anaerolineae bacterium]